MQTNSRLAVIVTVFLACGVWSAPADAADEDGHRLCRRAIATGLKRWVEKSIKIRQQCRSRIVAGMLSSDTDCSGATTDPVMSRRLARADDQLERDIVLACHDADFTLLSYPGACPDAAGEFDGEDLAACIVSRGSDLLEQVLAIQYPSPPSFLRGHEAHCLVAAAGRARIMMTGELRGRLSCRLARESGELSQGVDCLAMPPPYGPGTGSDAHDEIILRAYLAWLTALPAACARIGLDDIRYEGCPASSDGGFDVHEFRRCIFDANTTAVFSLLDLAFPTDPVCGNGIPQEGEACDNGAANSDATPDACRTDCSLPRCSDGVTDAAETCDDGNLAALDGCDAACRMEFCGDGTVNDAPPEQCDDGNGVASDLCTPACRHAVCGDGFVCTSAACTSGPGGGAERCDNGVDNGPHGACQSDCSGFRYTCRITIGVTSSELLGGVTYQMDYPTAPGLLLGSGTSVRCSSLVPNALSSFFDNDGTRRLRHSVILASGVQAPAALARCSFATDDPQLAANAFALTLADASNPDFEPRQPVLAVTSVACE
ncbi:MAG TPA: DUF4215 domain-containing protein [Candidatus Limnocylindrales bacterium]|nr:DUF4215 domain-containing protein [Candidatus Limnocylindrales bacterium]